MRVRIRSYCYGCRRLLGDSWHRFYAQGRHRWEWEFYIHCDGRRLAQRQSFATFERALASAQRAYIALANNACIGAAA